MTHRKDITGIILSGGKSSRMGSDKGFIKLNDIRFVEYSIRAMEPVVSEILIVSDNKEYDIFGFERIEDEIKDAGPVSGIYSGLKASKTEYNLILSCDIPLIKTNILEKLIDHIDGDSEIIQIESNKKTMPLVALYKKECASVFLNALNHDERRLRKVITNMNTKNVVLKIEDQNTTMNVNTPEELKIIENEYNS